MVEVVLVMVLTDSMTVITDDSEMVVVVIVVIGTWSCPSAGSPPSFRIKLPAAKVLDRTAFRTSSEKEEI